VCGVCSSTADAAREPRDTRPLPPSPPPRERDASIRERERMTPLPDGAVTEHWVLRFAGIGARVGVEFYNTPALGVDLGLPS